jgi:hypothetical protein
MQVKERLIQSDWSFAMQAAKYTEWMEAQVWAGRVLFVRPCRVHDLPPLAIFFAMSTTPD